MLLAGPDVILAPVQDDPGRDGRAERPDTPSGAEPYHQLRAVRLAGRDRRPVEPDVVGDAIDAGAWLRGSPTGDHPALRHRADLDRVGTQPARRTASPVAALIDGRIAARPAVGRHRDRGLRHREPGVMIQLDAFRLSGAVLVVMHDVGPAHDAGALLATQRDGLAGRRA